LGFEMLGPIVASKCKNGRCCIATYLNSFPLSIAVRNIIEFFRQQLIERWYLRGKQLA
jgi:hypothetical protein